MFLLNLLRDKVLEVGLGQRNLRLDVLDDRVELLLGILVVVALAGKADAETVRDVLDTGGPDGLVEASINADVLGAHMLLGERADGLDGRRGTLLEGAGRKRE